MMKKVLLIVVLGVTVVFAFTLGKLKESNPNRLNDLWINEETLNDDVILLSTQLSDGFHENDQYEEFFSLHQKLIQTSISLKSEWMTLMENRNLSMSYRSLMIENDLKMSLEDRYQTRIEIIELKLIKDSFVASNGIAREKMNHLKDEFSYQNIDLILDTYREVIGILNDRLELLTQANEIMVKLNTRFITYIES